MVEEPPLSHVVVARESDLSTVVAEALHGMKRGLLLLEAAVARAAVSCVFLGKFASITP